MMKLAPDGHAIGHLEWMPDTGFQRLVSLMLFFEFGRWSV